MTAPARKRETKATLCPVCYAEVSMVEEAPGKYRPCEPGTKAKHVCVVEGD